MPTRHSDDKDRFGDKLRDVERAREDQWAASHDKELIEKLRRQQDEMRQTATKAAEAMGMLCPKCQRPLASRSEAGITMMECPDQHGAWLDHDALTRLIGSGKRT